MDDPDLEMGGTAGELLSQMQPGVSSTSTPAPHGTSALPSAVATPGEMGVPSPAPQIAASEQKLPQSVPVDAAMGNTGPTSQNPPQAAPNAPDQGGAGADWVMVPKGGVSPDAAANTAPDSEPSGVKETPTPAPPSGAASAARQGSAAGTPVEGGSGSFDNDFSSLGDLDTAGDALASYETPGGPDLGDGLDLNMDMDDSAFGEAFHGVSNSGTPADSNAEI